MIKFNPKTGLVSFLDTDFKQGKIIFNFEQFNCTSERLKWSQTRNGSLATEYGCEFKALTEKNMLFIEVKNVSERDIFLKEILIIHSPSQMENLLAASDYLEYIHSSSFGEHSGVKKVGLSNRWLKHNPEGSMAYVLQNIDSKDSCLFSTLPSHKGGDYVTFRALHDSPHLEGNFGLEIKSVQQKLIKPGIEATTSAIQCRTGNDPLLLLAELGRQWRKGRKLPMKDVKKGWNSWDYYAGAVTSDDIYKNQKQAKRHFAKKIEYFVIDEGWEPRWGVWEANWKFPEGLIKFCQNIRAGGGIPGIWTAPLMVNTYTSLYREHPDWFGRDKNGQVVGTLYSYGPMAYLDITNPEVEKHIFDLFKRLKEQGFEYFKVDFTQEILRCKLFYDMSIPRGNILRKVFETIRKAIGKEAYLLACGAPYESITGIVDAVRVTGDIHNFWGHVLNSALTISSRWWMHRTLWNIDPDFLIIRTKDTSTDTLLNREYVPKPFEYGKCWLKGRENNIKEAKAYALLIYLCAGDVFLGDNLTKLNKTGIELIKKVLKRPLTNAAVPVDLFAGHDTLPSKWVAEEKDFWFIGIFNWEEDAVDIAVDLQKLCIVNYSRIESFWDGKRVLPGKGIINLHLEPRSCKGLKIEK